MCWIKEAVCNLFSHSKSERFHHASIRSVWDKYMASEWINPFSITHICSCTWFYINTYFYLHWQSRVRGYIMLYKINSSLRQIDGQDSCTTNWPISVFWHIKAHFGGHTFFYLWRCASNFSIALAMGVRATGCMQGKSPRTSCNLKKKFFKIFLKL